MKQAQSWRLLNEGEEIREGDEFYSQGWKTAVDQIGKQLGDRHPPYRRPLTTGWIKLSERVPTEADAGGTGHILVLWEDGQYSAQRWNHVGRSFVKAWLPLPKFEETDKDEEAFEKLCAEEHMDTEFGYDKMRKRYARAIWDRALAYAREQR